MIFQRGRWQREVHLSKFAKIRMEFICGLASNIWDTGEAILHISAVTARS
ncbi:hypothetical protein [Paenibacillus sp. PK3_47]|nr:hypothetical protein [Paenibacillus sp. PK3_47]